MAALTDSVSAAERNKRGRRRWFLLPWKVEVTFNAQGGDTTRGETQLIESVAATCNNVCLIGESQQEGELEP